MQDVRIIFLYLYLFLIQLYIEKYRCFSFIVIVVVTDTFEWLERYVTSKKDTDVSSDDSFTNRPACLLSTEMQRPACPSSMDRSFAISLNATRVTRCTRFLSLRRTGESVDLRSSGKIYTNNGDITSALWKPLSIKPVRYTNGTLPARLSVWMEDNCVSFVREIVLVSISLFETYFHRPIVFHSTV